MIKTLYEIEKFFSKMESVHTRSYLNDTFGQDVVNEAVTNGLLREFKLPCDKGGEKLCWLTNKGRKNAMV
jgi:hypothetical protein